ncbi:DcrB-related protein [Archangium primigenium]|uniref:DcrB-related protein n=1 Tax=[Archangium] primigenium TaxID=2792470 RepID=UPI001959BE29|nr:DcrB-related protein [Archangium primigenium]MBM7116674.1 DcrB-related protein [Archangium primigenium]
MSASHVIRHGALVLSLPPGWFDASQVVAVGPEDNGFRANVVVSVEPAQPGETLTQFAARSLVALRGTQDITLVDERQATFGAHQGMLREYTFTLRGVKLAQLGFTVVKEQVGYTFTYTQRPERLAETRGVAETFFASARLESAAPAPGAPPSGSGLDSLW